MKSLANKNIVITGAASGIGRQMANLFAQEKSNVAIIDIDEKALKETQDELSKYDVKVQNYSCDLSKKDAIDETANKIKNDFHQIDILVNNAGVISGKPIDELSYEEIKLTIDVNLIAVILMTKHFMRGMMDRNSGHIVNVSSAAGLTASPKMGDYCASKYGAVGFSEALRMEFQKYGAPNVKVLVVCPALIDTGMFEGFKMPPMSPILKPEYVAKKVIESVKKDKHYLKLPSMVKMANFMKLFPVSFQDKLNEISGVSKAMDEFVGRKS